MAVPIMLAIRHPCPPKVALVCESLTTKARRRTREIEEKERSDQDVDQRS